MAVTSVKPGVSGSFGRATLDVRVFSVVFDTIANGSVRAARTADDGVTAIPSKGDAHPDDSTLKVDDITARPVGNGLMYDVVVNYTGWQSDSGESDPAAQAAVITWGYEVTTEPYDKDEDDEDVLNSASECFDPPPTREVYDEVVTIVKNVSADDWATILAGKYNGSTNTDSATVDGRTIDTVDTFGKGKITVESRKIARGDYSYREVTFRIRIREDGWRHRILDQGYRDSNGDEFKDDNGETRSMPTLLDGAGAENATAVYLTYRPSPAKAWAALTAYFS